MNNKYSLFYSNKSINKFSLGVLTKRAHRILNMVESLDIALYNEWNNLFILINKAKTKPCDEYISEAKILKKYTQKIVY